MEQGRMAAALLGALVADAAALGLHWLYDVGRISEVVARHGGAAFVPPDPANFEGVPAYFAHGARRDGMLTQYGEGLAVALRVVAGAGGYDRAAHQAAYECHFGAGGAYVGYIDRPTRGTLANLAAGQVDPSGIDDDQLPALVAVPAVLAGHRGRPDLPDTVRAAVGVTNVNDTAFDGAARFADLLGRVVAGEGVAAALAAVADGPMQAALAAPEADSTAYGEVTGRACHLPMALPLAAHVLARADSFEGAIEANIRAGGDSAGRAIVIGAVMGATHGIGGRRGIPLDWVLRLHEGRALWALCRGAAAVAG